MSDVTAPVEAVEEVRPAVPAADLLDGQLSASWWTELAPAGSG